MVLEGDYFDGRSADKQPVEVRYVGGSLQVHDPGEGRLETWHPDEFSVEGGNVAGEPLRLVHSKGSQLHFQDPGAAREFLRESNLLGGAHSWFSGWSLSAQIAVWSGLTVGVLVLMVVLIPVLAEPIARLAPEAAHDWLGNQALVAVDQHFGFCEDPEARAILIEFTGNLRDHSELTSEVTLHFVDHEVPNALAAPGGNVAVFRGLMDVVEEPEELAAIVGHEVAHVERRHAASGLVRSMGFRFLISAVFGDFTVAAQVGHTLLNHSHTRQDELEADYLGVKYLNQAGYSSMGMKTSFERLREEYGAEPLPYLSTHPTFDQRLEQLEDIVREGDAPFTESEWQRLQDLCE